MSLCSIMRLDFQMLLHFASQMNSVWNLFQYSFWCAHIHTHAELLAQSINVNYDITFTLERICYIYQTEKSGTGLITTDDKRRPSIRLETRGGQSAQFMIPVEFADDWVRFRHFYPTIWASLDTYICLNLLHVNVV